MKKLSLFVFAFVLAALLQAGPAKSFTLTPENAAVPAGKPVAAKAQFVCEPGYVLAGWNASIIRKNAPKEFFAKKGLKIRPHATAHDYDTVDFSFDGISRAYIHFNKALKEGSFPVIIPTAGLPEGDYQIAIMGRFMKNKQSFYYPCSFFLTITEGAAADVPFKPAQQSQPLAAIKNSTKAAAFSSITITPDAAEVKAGEKVAYTVKSKLAKADSKPIFAYVLLLRKDAAPGFFDREGLKYNKHPKASGYDSYRIVDRLYPDAEGVVKFEIDTTGYPAGTYLLAFQYYAKDSKGAPYYPTQSFALSIY